MTAFREVAEAEATGDVALVYEEIRRTYAVPYVSSLFRHLAVYPGLLPWAWGIVRPALLSGAAQRLAWQRVDIAELPPLPPLSREALARLGVDAAAGEPSHCRGTECCHRTDLLGVHSCGNSTSRPANRF